MKVKVKGLNGASAREGRKDSHCMAIWFISGSVKRRRRTEDLTGSRPSKDLSCSCLNARLLLLSPPPPYSND